MSSTSTEPHPAARALLHSKGKASQRPAFTPAQRSQIGLIRHTTAILAHVIAFSHPWQEGIGPGPFDRSVSLQPARRLE